MRVPHVFFCHVYFEYLMQQVFCVLQVLRFSRLFKPAYVPHIYKKRRKRRDDRSDGDGNCKADSLEAMSLTEYKDDSVADSERLADDYFTEQELSERFKLDFGRPAMVEEVDIDDEVWFCFAYRLCLMLLFWIGL